MLCLCQPAEATTLTGKLQIAVIHRLPIASYEKGTMLMKYVRVGMPTTHLDDIFGAHSGTMAAGMILNAIIDYHRFGVVIYGTANDRVSAFKRDSPIFSYALDAAEKSLAK